jgi:hypothetical protein
MEDEVVGEATLRAKKVGVRVLAVSDDRMDKHHARLIASDGRTRSLGRLTTEYVNSSAFLEALSEEGTTADWSETSKEVLVCTHGARDCRCGDIGGDLVAALRKEVTRRASDVAVGEVSHVGGHK